MTSGGDGRHRASGRAVSAGVAVLPINAPLTVIGKENFASKLLNAVTHVDPDVESELFNRSYHVISEDRRFARALLDARVVDLMASTEGQISFEFFGRRLLVHAVVLEPELVPGRARLAAEFHRILPRLVLERWPGGDQRGVGAAR